MKIPKKPKTCQYENCTEPATELACGRRDGHSNAAWYCEAHADTVLEERFPEYVVNCPCCGCRFGVN